MEVKINAEELLRLKNRSELLEHLEIGGIDNWEWYGESTKDYVRADSLAGYGISKPLKWISGDKPYYNNNECKFIGYVNEDFAVIVVELEPNYDIESGNCQGCMIGDSDNKIQCTCEDISDIVNMIEENTPATYIPLVVKASMLYDKPLIIQNHELELKILNEKQQELLNKTKEILLIKAKAEAKIKELESTKKSLEELNLLK